MTTEQLDLGGALSCDLFSRQNWVSACQFRTLSDAEVLSEVLHRVSKVSSPVVLLDLDSTLYDVGPRNYRILSEWALSKDACAFPLIQERVLQSNESQVGYSMQDTLLNLFPDMDVEKEKPAIQSAMSFWFKRFFTNEYLAYDRPYPGAVEFVKSLHEQNAQIVYLTGRDGPNMGDGTRSNFIRDRFPWEQAGVSLLMKSSFHRQDLDHKLEASEFVRQQGTLIASFENEPPNVVALAQKLPEAMHIFVDTTYSDHPTPLFEGLYRIRGFNHLA